jgi:hypothetical protein
MKNKKINKYKYSVIKNDLSDFKMLLSLVFRYRVTYYTLNKTIFQIDVMVPIINVLSSFFRHMSNI